MASSHSNKRPNSRRRLLRFLGAVLLTAVLVAIVLLVSMEHSAETGSGTLGVTISDSTVCARMGKNICFVSSGSYDLLDASGQLLVSGALALESPAISTCDTLAALYDIGGSTLRLLQSDGTTTDIVPAGDLISVQVSENAYTAVVSEATGYRALVSVYDRDGSEIYRWYTSSCWVLNAIVSPDSRQLAVLCLANGNSEVKIFSLNAEVQNAVFSVSNTMLIDLRWMSASSLCAWSTGQALFFSDDGTWRSTYDFAENISALSRKKATAFFALHSVPIAAVPPARWYLWIEKEIPWAQPILIPTLCPWMLSATAFCFSVRIPSGYTPPHWRNGPVFPPVTVAAVPLFGQTAGPFSSARSSRSSSNFKGVIPCTST